MLAASLLMMTSLVVQNPQAPPPLDPSSSSSSAPSASTPSQTTGTSSSIESGSPASSDRPHQIGVGAGMGLSTTGGGGSFRYFHGDRLGFDASIGMSRQNVTGGSGTGYMAATSAMWMFTKSNQLADIDLRPYLGGGVNYSSGYGGYTRTTTGSTRVNSVGGLGEQVYGGVEMTFHDANWVAISTQVAYYHMTAMNFLNGATSGTNFYILAHFYVK